MKCGAVAVVAIVVFEAGLSEERMHAGHFVPLDTASFCANSCNMEYTLLSSEAKETTKGHVNVESFELCTLTPKVLCQHCQRFPHPNHFYCRCGTLLLGSQNHPGAVE